MIRPTISPKLSINAVWLVALVTLGATIGVNYLIPHVVHGPLTPKTLAGVYFAVFAVGGAAACILTPASGKRVVGIFSLAALGLGIFYATVIAKAMAAAASAFGAGSGGASSFGQMAGIIFGAGFVLVAIIGSLAGSLFGRKVRGEDVKWSVSLG